MKNALIALLLLPLSLLAAEPSGSFLSGIYADGLGVYRIHKSAKDSEFGAGLEIGYNVNKHVGIGLRNVGYKTPDDFGGYLVDESSVVVHTRIFSSENEKVWLGINASGTRDWNGDDWALGGGPSLQINLSKHFHIGAAAEVRSFIKGRWDLMVPVSLGGSF
jgi:hypothetical protein